MMQFGCFSIPKDITYENDYRSEYQRLRDIPEVAFATGGRCYKGIPDGVLTTLLKTADGGIIRYAANIFWAKGTGMEPVPEGGFRRYPVDYKYRLSLTEAKHKITGEQQKVRLVI